jgi:molybdenum cofactor cytidylyltransferase
MKTAVLVLAAGSASRFGSLKQLALIDDKPMLQHCIDTANSLFPNAVYTVLGNQFQTIIDSITSTNIIINPQWQCGLGSSIAVGTSYLQDHFDAILILLADQPRIKSHHLKKLIDLFEGQQVACSRYNNRLGVPAIFAKPYFTALKQLTGDSGGKVLLESISPVPKSLAMANATSDIDYPEDLANLV